MYHEIPTGPLMPVGEFYILWNAILDNAIKSSKEKLNDVL